VVSAGGLLNLCGLSLPGNPDPLSTNSSSQSKPSMDPDTVYLHPVESSSVGFPGYTPIPRVNSVFSVQEIRLKIAGRISHSSFEPGDAKIVGFMARFS